MGSITLETRANQPQLIIAKVNQENAFDAVELMLKDAYLSRGVEFLSRGDSGTTARKLMANVKNSYDNSADCNFCPTQPYRLHVDMYYHADSFGGDRIHMYFLANADGLIEQIASKERNFFANFYYNRLENGR
ncbi:MAG: hypothetical protein ACOCQX_01580 [Candidatus Nanoarchaeia archaeon]